LVDTSVWIDHFAGRPAPHLEQALERGSVVLSPIVVAELISGAREPEMRQALAALLQDFPLHPTPIDHWIRVGDLRRALSGRGLTVSTPDAHVARSALDRDAFLLTRDRVFARIAELQPLRLLEV
jgi:hypothetical protein